MCVHDVEGRGGKLKSKRVSQMHNSIHVKCVCSSIHHSTVAIHRFTDSILSSKTSWCLDFVLVWWAYHVYNRYEKGGFAILHTLCTFLDSFFFSVRLFDLTFSEPHRQLGYCPGLRIQWKWKWHALTDSNVPLSSLSALPLTCYLETHVRNKPWQSIMASSKCVKVLVLWELPIQEPGDSRDHFSRYHVKSPPPSLTLILRVICTLTFLVYALMAYLNMLLYKYMTNIQIWIANANEYDTKTV